MGSIPGLGRSPGAENGNPLQYSCLRNPMDGGAWQAVVYGVAELDTAEHIRRHLMMQTPVSSVTPSCPSLCDPVDCSTPGLPVHHQPQSLLKPMSIESAMPPSHLILCRPLLLLPSLSQVAEVLEFRLQYQSFQCAFRTDLL